MISSERQQEIKQTCKILAQMSELDEKAKSIEREKFEQSQLKQQLENLTNLMQESGINYTRQLSTVERALSVVQSQIDWSEAVHARYHEVLRILEIEYLARQINSQLAYFSHKIFNNIEQIERLERERDSLREQLALIPIPVNLERVLC